MATPVLEDGSDKVLTLNLTDPALDWDEISIFDPDPDEVDQQELFFKLRRFMIHRSNWTRREIGKLTVEDQTEIIGSVRAAITEKSLPKQNGSISADGPAAK